ncbi:MAG TPA: KH domain-containing protein [Candidatus Acidoferrum sp.]|nr:KH domain-containing protein [Candidatus Acidoferrum sp.]
MRENIKAPYDRIGVLIGINGSTKSEIEKRGEVTIDIDSKAGTIIIESDSINALRAVDVVKAIARGFSPERAYRLFDDEMVILDIIELSKSVSTPKELKRILGRIIGKDGKTREIIESLTGSYISVYGKTISVIGYPEQTQIVRKAIEMLVEGAPHGTVYGFLEKKKQELKRAQMDYYM